MFRMNVPETQLAKQDLTFLLNLDPSQLGSTSLQKKFMLQKYCETQNTTRLASTSTVAYHRNT